LIGRVHKYNVGMSADVPRRGEDDGPRATAVTFRSVVEERPGQRLRDLFDLWWPAYRRWFLRDGEQERSSYAGCLRGPRSGSAPAARNRHAPARGHSVHLGAGRHTTSPRSMTPSA